MKRNQLIVGVRHDSDSTKQAVINYIDRKYPSLESIMLELHPDYKFFLPDNWFHDIANYYESKGVKIIPGDRKRLDVLGISSNEYAALKDEINPIKLTKYLLLEKFRIYLGFINGKLIRDRNIDMDSVFKEYAPDVTVVGNFHSIYLKEKNPEVYFASFRGVDHLELNLPSISDYKTKKIAQDRFLIDINKFNPEQTSTYVKNTFFVALAFAVYAASLRKYTDSEFPSNVLYWCMSGLSAYIGINYSKNVLHFVRSLKHNFLDKKSVNF